MLEKLYGLFEIFERVYKKIFFKDPKIPFLLTKYKK